MGCPIPDDYLLETGGDSGALVDKNNVIDLLEKIQERQEKGLPEAAAGRIERLKQELRNKDA